MLSVGISKTTSSKVVCRDFHLELNNEFHLFLKRTWNLLQDRSHLGHKASLGKFKKIEIIPSIFSDQNAVRLDLNYRRKTIKNSNIWSPVPFSSKVH